MLEAGLSFLHARYRGADKGLDDESVRTAAVAAAHSVRFLRAPTCSNDSIVQAYQLGVITFAAMQEALAAASGFSADAIDNNATPPPRASDEAGAAGAPAAAKTKTSARPPAPANKNQSASERSRSLARGARPDEGDAPARPRKRSKPQRSSS